MRTPGSPSRISLARENVPSNLVTWHATASIPYSESNISTFQCGHSNTGMFYGTSEDLVVFRDTDIIILAARSLDNLFLAVATVSVIFLGFLDAFHTLRHIVMASTVFLPSARRSWTVFRGSL